MSYTRITLEECSSFRKKTEKSPTRIGAVLRIFIKGEEGGLEINFLWLSLFKNDINEDDK